VDAGFLDALGVARAVRDLLAGEFYVCGPAGFMETVESALCALGVDEHRLHFERFVSPPDPVDGEPSGAPAAVASEVPQTISVYLDGRTRDVPYEAGQTILATVQRAGLEPPFSCTEGFCGCCMAKLRGGRVRMIKNDFLSQRELEDGWILTCQSVPQSSVCSVEYPDRCGASTRTSSHACAKTWRRSSAQRPTTRARFAVPRWQWRS
jgi:3-ketosteroid 9alpha-monooxygenase subunit B